MYDLKQFTLADMTRCGAELRRFGSQSKSMEQAAAALFRKACQNILQYRHFAEQLRCLKCAGDAAPGNRVRRESRDGGFPKCDLTRGWRVESTQYIQKNGLARTIWPD